MTKGKKGKPRSPAKGKGKVVWTAAMKETLRKMKDAARKKS